jgi:hypothetical protein
VAANCQHVTMDFNVTTGTLEGAIDEEIFAEAKRRNLERYVAEQMTEDELMQVMMAAGIRPMFDARPTRLIHELRRQAKGVSYEASYNNKKKKGLPHCTDKAGANLLKKEGKGTRQSKKKVSVTHYLPRSVTDYRLKNI